MEAIVTLGLVLLTLLGGAVLYLAVNQQKYQRMDPSRVLDDDLRERQFEKRLRYLEQLIADLAKLETTKRSELDRVVAAAKQDLGEQVEDARSEIVSHVLLCPEDVDGALLKHAGIHQGQDSPTSAHPEPRLANNPSMVNFLRSPRQREIAELLELGYTHQDTSRMLAVSRHEIDLVASIIFSEKSA